MPQYAVLIYAPDAVVADEGEGTTPENDRHAEELAASGSMLVAYALTPREFATSIRASGVTDGPFIESKEIVAGFYVIEAADLDAAIRIARTNPAVAAGGGVEVRPVHGGGPVGDADG